MFFTQLNELCTQNGTTPTKFTTDVLKLSSSKVTAWKNGSIPKYEILKKIASYFDVTVGYLFDGKEKKHPQSEELTEDEERLLDMYSLLSDMEKGEILGELKMKTANRHKKENEEIA